MLSGSDLGLGGGLSCPEKDRCSTHLWNVGRQSIYTAVQPRRQLWTSYSPPWELEISQVRHTWCILENLVALGDESHSSCWQVEIHHKYTTGCTAVPMCHVTFNRRTYTFNTSKYYFQSLTELVWKYQMEQTQKFTFYCVLVTNDISAIAEAFESNSNLFR
jgi:hypothetical protein